MRRLAVDAEKGLGGGPTGCHQLVKSVPIGPCGGPHHRSDDVRCPVQLGATRQACGHPLGPGHGVEDQIVRRQRRQVHGHIDGEHRPTHGAGRRHRHLGNNPSVHQRPTVDLDRRQQPGNRTRGPEHPPEIAAGEPNLGAVSEVGGDCHERSREVSHRHLGDQEIERPNKVLVVKHRRPIDGERNHHLVSDSPGHLEQRILGGPLFKTVPQRPNRRHQVGVNRLPPPPDRLRGRSIGKVHRARHRTHAGACDTSRRQPLLVENLKHSQVSETACATATKGEDRASDSPQQSPKRFWAGSMNRHWDSLGSVSAGPPRLGLDSLIREQVHQRLVDTLGHPSALVGDVVEIVGPAPRVDVRDPITRLDGDSVPQESADDAADACGHGVGGIHRHALSKILDPVHRNHRTDSFAPSRPHRRSSSG